MLENFCTTSEKAEQWHVTKKRVREFCHQGVIPSAERFPFFRWRIPRYSIKPPMARHGLCFLLEYINLLKEGAALDFSKCGYSEITVHEAYNYLISYGFMTSFNWDNKEKELPKCEITQRGLDLIEREQNEVSIFAQSKAKTKFNNVNDFIKKIAQRKATKKVVNTVVDQFTSK